MPNPRVTFRCPVDLYSQLPENERERSQLIIELLLRHYQPQNPEDKISQIEQQLNALQTAFNRHFS